MRPLILSAALALLMLATGCQSAHPFATPDASWKSRIGQLKHTDKKRTLVGEVVVQQRAPREFQLDFLKGGTFPLLSIRQDATTARAEGLLAGGRWQGEPTAAPPALRPWLALREAFTEPAANPPRVVASGSRTGDPEKSGGMTLIFPEEKQRFVFQFQR